MKKVEKGTESCETQSLRVAAVQHVSAPWAGFFTVQRLLSRSNQTETCSHGFSSGRLQ